jgi:hypothetical protein
LIKHKAGVLNERVFATSEDTSRIMKFTLTNACDIQKQMTTSAAKFGDNDE